MLHVLTIQPDDASEDDEDRATRVARVAAESRNVAPKNPTHAIARALREEIASGKVRPAPRAAAHRAVNTYGVVLGTKGNGKTTYALLAARARLNAGGRVVWIDAGGVYLEEGALPGAVVVHSGAAWWSYVRAQTKLGKGFCTVVQLGFGQSHDALWRMLYEYAKAHGGLLLVLDEAQYYANSQRIDQNLEYLLSVGRHAQIDIISTTRLLRELSPLLRGNKDLVVCFRVASARAARVVNEEFFDLPKSFNHAFAKLPKYHYLRTEEGAVTRGTLPRPPWL